MYSCIDIIDRIVRLLVGEIPFIVRSANQYSGTAMKVVFPMTKKTSMVNVVGSLATWIDEGMSSTLGLLSVCYEAAGIYTKWML